ncbi:hypothetical protein BO78DRAFT_409358 [Aspergillus sclerotiicarbonarius CBS 121057]|uniref:P-loop containing nucleoside triphosphate hydrolase protein n=1 Tax=Aspergillus sclerotiicarbonarius (strain CBS 121057 / IBT 28362) TaxID=1448318 RepID=A0A319E288_ASPSB|nr:hypothetical protein BO78DRAFT_409358 [Aspergillus sclerotiicarbonarius CBS 121057]
MSERKVPRVVDFSPVVRRHLGWYNGFLPAPRNVLNLDRDKFRRHRESRVTVHGYQTSYSDMFCYVDMKAENQPDFRTVSCPDNTTIKFSIRGGAEIPHFCLVLEITGSENRRRAFTIIWTAFGDKGFDVDRPSYQLNHNPAEAQGVIHTFSSRLQGVKFLWTKLAANSAPKCRGTPNSDNYTIYWGHSEAPYSMGFDAPDTAMQCFSVHQRQAVDSFRQLLSSDLQIRVVTRARGDLMENWRFFAAMPSPTPGPYPLYDCRYVPGGSWCRMKTLPGIDDVAIVNHFGIRERGWMNNPPSWARPPRLGMLCPAKLQFINEREYEVIKTIGLLREVEYQRTAYCDKFNRGYRFSLHPASLVHGVETEGVEQYFYAILDVTPVELPSDSFVENDSALPEPGTQVTVTEPAREGIAQQTWSGLVIQRSRFPPNIRTKTTGNILEVSGYVRFGNVNPAFQQAKAAIRFAMYGNQGLGIPRNNRLREILLAHNNDTFKYDAPLQPGTAARKHLDSLRNKLNEEQLAAVREGIMSATSSKNYVSLITGPPGTGKSRVSAHIAHFHRKVGNRVLIVCGSNHGLDEIARKIIQVFQEENLGTDGIFRLDTEFGEDPDVQMPPDVPQPTAETARVFQSTMQQLKKSGIDPAFLQLLHASVEAMNLQTDSVSNKQLSLGQYILRRLDLAVQQKSQWPQTTDSERTEMALLWQLITYRHCLARRGLLFLETAETNSSTLVAQTSGPKDDPEGILTQLVTSYHRAWSELQEFYLGTSRVVLCTASTAERKPLRSFKPEITIVEEATQISESICVSSLIRFYASLKKIILSGDTAQLPPTVTSVNKNEAVECEKVSLFERLLSTGVRNISLKTQSRMHPDISQFVTLHFYGGGLVNHSSTSVASPIQDFLGKRFNVRPGRSYFLSVTNSTVWRRRGGTSLFNAHYIGVAAELARDLCKAGCAAENIMILSYYAEERNLLRRLINDVLELHQVDILTVDAAQGKEKGIVIVSTTRPGGQSGLGHVADVNRMCVALSRAKGGLVVIGDHTMGGTASSRGFQLWRDLIQHHKSKNHLAIVDGSDKILREKLGLPNEESCERMR